MLCCLQWPAVESFPEEIRFLKISDNSLKGLNKLSCCGLFGGSGSAAALIAQCFSSGTGGPGLHPFSAAMLVDSDAKAGPSLMPGCAGPPQLLMAAPFWPSNTGLPLLPPPRISGGAVD